MGRNLFFMKLKMSGGAKLEDWEPATLHLSVHVSVVGTISALERALRVWYWIKHCLHEKCLYCSFSNYKVDRCFYKHVHLCRLGWQPNTVVMQRIQEHNASSSIAHLSTIYIPISSSWHVYLNLLSFLTKVVHTCNKSLTKDTDIDFQF